MRHNPPEEAQLGDIANFIETGELKRQIDLVFALDQGKEALLYSQTTDARGKTVLQVR